MNTTTDLAPLLKQADDSFADLHSETDWRTIGLLVPKLADALRALQSSASEREAAIEERAFKAGWQAGQDRMRVVCQEPTGGRDIALAAFRQQTTPARSVSDRTSPYWNSQHDHELECQTHGCPLP